MKDFAGFLSYGNVLIILILLYVTVIAIGTLITNSAGVQQFIRRKAIRFVVWLEKVNSLMKDDEPFDASWMDAKKWMKTR